MASELYWMTLTALMTGLMWVPYILNRLAEMGLWTALRNPRPDGPPKAAWAYRVECAHRNAVENLVVFAPLALAISFTGMGTALTAQAAAVFFFARLAHFLIYAFGIPALRTVAFAVGMACQVILALTLLGLV